MNDITKHYRFHRLLVEASNYRVLCHLLKADPEVTPGTVALVRNVIASDRDDAAFFNEIATA
jgi:hypothetical protein